jgi:hypothetical protein
MFVRRNGVLSNRGLTTGGWCGYSVERRMDCCPRLTLRHRQVARRRTEAVFIWIVSIGATSKPTAKVSNDRESGPKLSCQGNGYDNKAGTKVSQVSE